MFCAFQSSELLLMESMDTELLRAALIGLEHRWAEVEQKISEIRRMLGEEARGNSSRPAPKRKKRTLSAATRKRMAAAQRKRWAAVRKAGKPAKRAVAKKVAR
jgi:hypothetical protein